MKVCCQINPQIPRVYKFSGVTDVQDRDPIKQQFAALIYAAVCAKTVKKLI